MSKRAVAANTIIQLIGKVLSILINIVIVFFLTHHYSQTEYGEYTAIFSYLLFFNVFADLGLSTILVRDIHSYEENKQGNFIGNLVAIRIVSLFISLLAGILISFFIPAYNSQVRIGIAIGASSVFFLLLSTLLYSVFQVQLKMQRAVYANLAGLIVNVALVILFIKLHLSILYAVLAVSLGYLVILLVCAYFVAKTQKVSFRINRGIWKTVLSESFTIGGTIIFSSIYFKSDSLILSFMKPYAVLSIYGVPYKVLEVLIAVPQMFMAPVFTLMSKELQAGNMDKFKTMMQKAFDLLVIAGLPIIPGAYFLSGGLILLYAGNKYAASVPVLQILSIAVFLSFLGSSLIYVILAIKKQRYLFYWNIFLSIFNISLNLLLIPKYSYFASAWLTVATEALVLIGSLYFTWRSLSFLPAPLTLLKGLPATALFTLTLFLLRDANFIFAAAVALSIYVIVLFITKVVAISDIRDIIKP